MQIKMTISEEREKARKYLSVLFNINSPKEEEIMYMLGLFHSGVDIIALALGRLAPMEYGQAFPPSAGDDVDKQDLIHHGWHEKREEQ